MQEIFDTTQRRGFARFIGSEKDMEVRFTEGKIYRKAKSASGRDGFQRLK